MQNANTKDSIIIYWTLFILKLEYCIGSFAEQQTDILLLLILFTDIMRTYEWICTVL